MSELMWTRTKIVATIGPASSSTAQIQKLIAAGINVARLNFSHGTHEEHKETIARLKQARVVERVPLAIMLDTKGPEIRVGTLTGGSIELVDGQAVTLGKHTDVCDIPIFPHSVLDDLQVGMEVLFDDGYIATQVISKKGSSVQLKVLNGGELKSNKGANIPHEAIQLPTLTEQDCKDIIFGCDQGVDIIAASFVRSVEHLEQIRAIIKKHSSDAIKVIAKIESVEGVKHFDSILEMADGIMIARGDLGVEIPLPQVPTLQKMMIRKCYEAYKPVITATQMLESMIYYPRPTRAEASDVANAVWDSTACMMLSGETAAGKYPVAAVQMMKKIAVATEADFNYIDFFHRDIGKQTFSDISSAVAFASIKTAYTLGAKAIFVFTSQGFTAGLLSRFRPQIPIIALTCDERTYHQLSYQWGVVPVHQKARNSQEGFEILRAFSLDKGIVVQRDLVVITIGDPFGISGTTNKMVVRSI